MSFTLPKNVKVNVSIFNIKGQKVTTLKSEYMTAGDHSVVWNGNDETGKMVSSGVFFYKVETNHETVTGKMLLLK